jgi:hypothetical protein
VNSIVRTTVLISIAAMTPLAGQIGATRTSRSDSVELSLAVTTTDKEPSVGLTLRNTSATRDYYVPLGNFGGNLLGYIRVVWAREGEPEINVLCRVGGAGVAPSHPAAAVIPLIARSTFTVTVPARSCTVNAPGPVPLTRVLQLRGRLRAFLSVGANEYMLHLDCFGASCREECTCLSCQDRS